MSQENVEIVLESIRRFRPEGLDEWAQLWDPDTRLTVPEGWPEPGPFIGLDAARRQFERFLDSFSAFRFENVEIVADSGDWVVAMYRIPASGTTSGLEADFRLAAAYRVEDGLLIECAIRLHVDEPSKPPGCGSSGSGPAYPPRMAQPRLELEDHGGFDADDLAWTYLANVKAGREVRKHPAKPRPKTEAVATRIKDRAESLPPTHPWRVLAARAGLPWPPDYNWGR